MKQEGIQKTNFVVNLLSGLVLVKKETADDTDHSQCPRSRHVW